LSGTAVHRLVFLDESGAKTNMTRLRGRAARGQRVHDHAPHGHWCTTTMISSIRLDGSTACMAIEGPTTSEVFAAYVSGVLVPSLSPGDLVIMDNLSSHKSAAALALIEGAGAKVLFLPAYSPDLNPIEKMWSKVKEFLRSSKARSQEALLAAIASALRLVTSRDAVGWFASCGYNII
jgi:transposase